MAEVTLENVVKRYGTVQVVHGVDLEIASKEFVVLVGPSGCGKSTTLRMIAGLEEISDGTISIGDRVVNEVAPKDRDVAMVFQNYALYPHLNVAENIAFGLRIRRVKKQEIASSVTEVAKILGLTDYLERRPPTSPAVSANGWRWAGRSCAIPRFSCSTSPCPTSMPSCARKCAPRLGACTTG